MTSARALALDRAFAACALNDDVTLETLLRENAIPVSARDGRGNTLLHLCCVDDAARAARAVVSRAVFASRPAEYGYLWETNDDGETALETARACGSETCARWLEALTGAGGGAAPGRGTDGGGGGEIRTERRNGGGRTMGREWTLRAVAETVGLDWDASRDAADDRTKALWVARETARVVRERETLREELKMAQEKIKEHESRAEEERRTVVAALGMAESRARAMAMKSENEKADRAADRAALRDARRATSDEYERGYAEGWAAALRLPSREYVREQMKLEQRGRASASGDATSAGDTSDAAATAAAFEDISLDDENASPSKESATATWKQVTNVIKETFVGVKKTVDAIESRQFGASKAREVDDDAG